MTEYGGIAGYSGRSARKASEMEGLVEAINASSYVLNMTPMVMLST